MPDNEPTVWASLGATINTGNYENQKIDIGIAGVPINATPEYLEEILNKATITIHSVVERLAEDMSQRMHDDYGR